MKVRLRWVVTIGVLFALVVLVVRAITWPPGGSPATGPTVVTLGKPVHLSGETVTMQSVIDPAQPANEFSYPGADGRFVGVELEIRNTGSHLLVGNAATETFAQASNGETFDAVATPVVECSDFYWGQYAVPPEGSQVACIAFAVPLGVLITSIRLNAVGRSAIWTVSS